MHKKYKIDLTLYSSRNVTF